LRVIRWSFACGVIQLSLVIGHWSFACGVIQWSLAFGVIGHWSLVFGCASFDSHLLRIIGHWSLASRHSVVIGCASLVIGH